jgi:DNA-nicking Smr family endonuclease
MSDPPGRRRLSTDDEALWRGVTRSVKPLKRRRVEPEAKAASGKKVRLAPVERPHIAPAPAAPKAPPLVPLDRRFRQRLARGATEIDARLDLHGRTQSEAHAVLIRFLHRAQGDGARTVLVITGKGAGAGEGRGVLKRQVPMWLTLPELRACVLGFEDANVAHGGSGALYVRLRRGR